MQHGLRPPDAARIERRGAIETLEAETLALTLVRRALGERTSHAAGGSAGRQKLADRAKLVLAGDLARRWTLAEIAAEVGVSPVYLTQVFQQVEGAPLYRYQLRLRLARALDLIADCDDLTALGLDLGFASHSHFTAAFRRAYGRTPGAFRKAARALDLIEKTADLTALGLELGFSSHSHFTAAFRSELGVTPSHYRASSNGSASPLA